jgi:hypothetical protein
VCACVHTYHTYIRLILLSPPVMFVCVCMMCVWVCVGVGVGHV